ncbi:MoaD/ThiS family protein [Tamlana haliotis]|uniref:MoaD/ThiS family protein n=1 Tax=Pseudotamlana haliotis TaxID=2614804 RepID=A0A6N6MI66_9FLAO|nr:MoaD/ThiS family protein [Tamlana haliotis]KAB1069168.1 MoaD/ThiS family protein [Tamlana haliotis]
MILTIKYFGQIAEITQKDEESLTFSGNLISELLDLLHSKYSGLKLKEFQVAQNQELVTLDTELSGAEIALLPPFAGG